MSLKARKEQQSSGPCRSCHRRGLQLVALLSGLAVLACSDADITGECGSLATGMVGVGSWWGLEQESEARRALDRGFMDCNLEPEVDPMIFDSKKEAMDGYAALLNRMDDRREPASLDVLIGNPDLMRFAGCTAGSDALLLGLDDEDKIGIGERDFFPGLMKALSCPDRPQIFYAVPLSVHRLNNLFYNKQRLKEAGIDPKGLEEWDGFMDALRKLRLHEDAQVGNSERLISPCPRRLARELVGFRKRDGLCNRPRRIPQLLGGPKALGRRGTTSHSGVSCTAAT